MEQGISIKYLQALKENYDQFVSEMEGAGVRVLRISWEEFRPVSDIVKLVHDFSLKPSSFTKWVRPLRRSL